MLTEIADPSGFRFRLLDGLAASIRERGFQETTIADVVRHARTSRRTFYAEFPSKEACFVALLEATNELMRVQISAAVDPDAEWTVQVGQAVRAYYETVASEPEIAWSWIRELPTLGDASREVQRAALDSLTQMLMELVDNDRFREAGVGPVSKPLALVLLGGLRELTATVVEDGGDVTDLVGVGVQAAVALLGSSTAPPSTSDSSGRVRPPTSRTRARVTQ